MKPVFAFGTAIGHWIDSLPGWVGWLVCFLFLSFYTWRCWREGEISTSPSYKWYGFKFNREESPEIFAALLILQIVLTLGVFILFMCPL